MRKVAATLAGVVLLMVAGSASALAVAEPSDSGHLVAQSASGDQQAHPPEVGEHESGPDEQAEANQSTADEHDSGSQKED